MFNDLQELTGQESGIVIYNNNEGILCNWSSINGLPRMFATGLIGMGEEIPEVKGERVEDLSDLFDGVEINIFADYDEEELPQSGTVYYLPNDVIVIAPDDWA